MDFRGDLKGFNTSDSVGRLMTTRDSLSFHNAKPRAGGRNS